MSKTGKSGLASVMKQAAAAKKTKEVTEEELREKRDITPEDVLGLSKPCVGLFLHWQKKKLISQVICARQLPTCTALTSWHSSFAILTTTPRCSRHVPVVISPPSDDDRSPNPPTWRSSLRPMPTMTQADSFAMNLLRIS